MGEPRIGVHVIETLTTGMYTNPLDCIREYVQNSFDSIRRAIREGVLSSQDGRIEVIIDPAHRVLRIRDNGLGVPNKDFAERLLNIGMSPKRADQDAGFRGIGRLGGVAYCERLWFKTSAPDESVSSQVEIDCAGLKQLLIPDQMQGRELVEVLTKHTQLSVDDVPLDEHFFEVQMEGVSPNIPSLLDWQAVEEYLSQVAPVEFDSQSFMYSSAIVDWATAHGLEIPTVTVVVKAPNVERQVFKPYKTHYRTRRGEKYDIHVNDVRFYPENATSDSPFWVWYSATDLLGQIDDTRSAGLRLRKNNIALGNSDRVTELFSLGAPSYGRFNDYYIGEVHINSPRAIPNARRDGLEDVGDWPEIKKSLLALVKKLAQDVHAASEQRNRPLAKVINHASKALEETNRVMHSGVVTKKERDELIERLDKEKRTLEHTLEVRRDEPGVSRIHPIIEEITKTKAQLESKKVFEGFRSDLDRKQRKLLSRILEILHDTLDDPTFYKAKNAILVQLGMSESESLR